MNKISYKIAFFFCLLVPASIYAQEEEVMEEEIYYNYPTKIPEKLSPVIDADFNLPAPLGNSAFQKISNGIVDMNTCFQLPVLKFLTIGAGFKFQYFQFRDFINANSTYSFSNSGKLFNYAPYGKISYFHFSTPRLFWQFSVRSGYAMKYFNSYSCANAGKGAHQQFDFFIEPQISVNLFVDESLSFSFLISDYMGFNTFNPELMCLESFSGLPDSDSIGNYNILGIGFGFSYFLNKKGTR